MSDSRNSSSSKPNNNSNTKSTQIVIRSYPSIQQPPHAYLYQMPGDVIRVIGSKLGDKHLAALSESCLSFYHVSQRDRNLRKFSKFLQAVVDNDRKTVQNILDADPNLLLAIPPQNLVIKSKKTWQRFYAETAWQMAGKRKQVKMVELLRSYVDKLDDVSKIAVLAQWKAPDVNNPEEKARLDERNKKLQEVYCKFLLPLVAVIAREPCPYGYHGQLSDTTEKALAEFRKTTLPDVAVRLDDYYDIDQLLIASYETYEANFDAFPEWNQRYVFRIHIHGWIQSLVQPELGQVFCESLWDVVENSKKIGASAASYMMKGKWQFYRASRDSLDGLGGKFLCDEYYGDVYGAERGWGGAEIIGRLILQEYAKQTNQSLANICRNGVESSVGFKK